MYRLIPSFTIIKVIIEEIRRLKLEDRKIFNKKIFLPKLFVQIIRIIIGHHIEKTEMIRCMLNFNGFSKEILVCTAQFS